MSKLSKVVLGTIGVACILALTHAWLNLGFDPLRTPGLKKEGQEEARFRVGFLPVT